MVCSSRFRATGWQVLTLKYGKKLLHLFTLPGGKTIRKWLIDCNNDLYCSLIFRGGKAMRIEMMKAIGDQPGVAETLGQYDDVGLLEVMSNLGGHCFEVRLFSIPRISNIYFSLIVWCCVVWI